MCVGKHSLLAVHLATHQMDFFFFFYSVRERSALENNGPTAVSYSSILQLILILSSESLKPKTQIMLKLYIYIYIAVIKFKRIRHSKRVMTKNRTTII